MRVAKAEKASFSLSKFLKSKVFSKKTKLRLYTAITIPTLTYGYEIWTTTSVTVRRLRTFENIIWRMILEPVCDTKTNEWKRKFNKELKKKTGLNTSYLKGQRIQWWGHIMRKSEEETIRAVIKWKPLGKRPQKKTEEKVARRSINVHTYYVFVIVINLITA